VDLTIDDAGNTFVVQTTSLSGSTNIVLVKFSSSGDTAWTRTYDGPNNASDIASGLALDNQGNIFVSGTTTPFSGSTDIVIAKYSPDGTLLWATRYDTTSSNERSNAIAVDDSGNVYVAGSTDKSSALEFLVMKLDPDGNFLWATPLPPDQSNPWASAQYIALDNNGHVYATGSTGSNIYTAKYTIGGDTVWARQYTRSGDYENAYSLAVDGDGNVFVGGSASDLNDTDFALLKYAPSGALDWVRHHDGPAGLNDAINDIALDQDGNVYATGETSDSAGFFTATTLKYSPAGDSLWMHTYSGEDLGPTGTFHSPQLPITDARTWRIFVVASYILLYGQRYDGAVFSVWMIALTAGGLQSAWLIATTPGFHLYCTTFAVRARVGLIQFVLLGILQALQSASGILQQSASGIYDMWARMYEFTTTGVEPVGGVVPESFVLRQNYPNPFNPSTTIAFSLPEASDVRLQVFDALGREVAELVRGRLVAGSYESAFDAGSLGTGMYFYRLRTGSYVETRRMMLVK
jgi:uncharacterized delta-60 repeat protein